MTSFVSESTNSYISQQEKKITFKHLFHNQNPELFLKAGKQEMLPELKAKLLP